MRMSASAYVSRRLSLSVNLSNRFSHIQTISLALSESGVYHHSTVSSSGNGAHTDGAYAHRLW